MEVLVGPAFAIEVPSSPPHSPESYDGEPPTNRDGDGESEVPRPFFEDGSGFRVRGHAGLFGGESSASSSSIGTPDDSDDEKDAVSSKNDLQEDEGEEVQSKLRKGLGSLNSLEDSLPIKKGLSNHFSGKSKSFTDLSQVSEAKSVKELQKQENPFNKRRRVLIASKWSRKPSSFYAWSNPQSMPLLPVDEDSDEPEEDEEGEEKEVGEDRKASSSSSSTEVLLRQQQQKKVPLSYAAHMRQRLGSFKSRSFSLADLQEHDEDEDEEEDEEDYDDDD